MTSTVSFYKDNGDHLCDIKCKVADDDISRYIGLSRMNRLKDGEGMLFLYRNEEERSFVMRDMDFDIDIIFADKDGNITEVHTAEAPQKGVPERSLEQYKGRAQAVVETTRGYAHKQGIKPGRSVLEVELEE